MTDHYDDWRAYCLAKPEVAETLTAMVFEWRAAQPVPCSLRELSDEFRRRKQWASAAARVAAPAFTFSFLAYFARQMMTDYPELRDPRIFRLRKSEADKHFPDLFSEADDDVQ